MAKLFQNTNTITIQGWMVNNLKLSGNELLIYAMIYGFSQDGDSEFYGALTYICSAVNCTRPTAINTLKILEEKNLIIKFQIKQKGNILNKYKANLITSKEILLVKNKQKTSKEISKTSKESLPNNINNNKLKESTLFPDLIKQNFEKEKQAKEKILFVDSIWNNFDNVKSHFISDKKLIEKYAYCDLAHYILRVDTWSENSQTKRTNRGWIMTLVDFIDQAKSKGEMRTIQKAKSKEQGHINY